MSQVLQRTSPTGTRATKVIGALAIFCDGVGGCQWFSPDTARCSAGRIGANHVCARSVSLDCISCFYFHGHCICELVDQQKTFNGF